jgi:hypothetical protein
MTPTFALRWPESLTGGACRLLGSHIAIAVTGRRPGRARWPAAGDRVDGIEPRRHDGFATPSLLWVSERIIDETCVKAIGWMIDHCAALTNDG